MRTFKQKVLATFRHAQAVEEAPHYWRIFEGNPLDNYELGFGSTELQAWKNAWKRYAARRRVVESSTSWTPTHTNHGPRPRTQ